MAKADEKLDTWPPSARLVVALLAMALGFTLITSSVAFIRAGNTSQKTDDAVAALETETKCNTDWKKAYRDAQEPRLAAQKTAYESTRTFYERIRTLTNGPLYPTREQQVASRAALDAAIEQAFNDVGKQLDAIDKFTYPKDDCGRDTTVGDNAPRKPLPDSKKENDNAPSGEAPLGSGGAGRSGGADSDGGLGVGGSGSAGGVGSSRSSGGGAVDPGSDPDVPGGNPPGAPSLLCGLLDPVLSLVRISGCGS